MYSLHMSRVSAALAMMSFIVASLSCAFAQGSTPDRPTQSESQKISRLRIPTYLAESITTRVVLPRDIGVPGDVVLEVLVQKNGRVLNVQRVSGDPRLVRAAKPAVMKWAFYPYLLNGEPVQFLTELTIMFDGKKDSAKLKIENDPLGSRNPEPK
jgi:TonB-like protein